jgi:hypothetical protein
MNNCFDCYLHNKKPVHFIYTDFYCASCKEELREEMWGVHFFLYSMREALDNTCTETVTKDSVIKLFRLYIKMRTSIKNMDDLLKNNFTKRSIEGREGIMEHYVTKELRGD